MTQDDEKPFRPRVRSTGKKAGGERFLAQVLKAAGGVRQLRVGRTSRPAFGPRASRGRGAVVARLRQGSLTRTSRRVIVKARFVQLARVGQASVRRHLRYLQREGVAREGDEVRMYGRDADTVDVQTFAERGRADRHQFRFIVSPEDGTALGDLREYTRTLMAQVERDLGTRLDWMAVDHWDTDNPHTHIVLRGKTDRGENLVIAREYLAEGMRTRASELATEWLGPRTEREIRHQRGQEIETLRRTGYDRALQGLAEDGQVDLRAVPEDVVGRERRSLLIGRLQRLARAGLAEPLEPGVWRLSPDLDARLGVLGERLAIAQRVARVLGATHEFTVFAPDQAPGPVAGRIAGRGLEDEATERGYLVIEGVDGRTHYVAAGRAVEVGALPRGGIVEVGARTRPRAVDDTIARRAEGGLYRVEQHRQDARRIARPDQDPEGHVDAHVRRLEALRRAGVVERVADGLWRVPENLPELGLRYDRSRDGGVIVTLHSALPLERQVKALGATWLDAQLLAESPKRAMAGFGLEVHRALHARGAFLVEQGFAEVRDKQLFVDRDLPRALRAREVERAGQKIAAASGLRYRPVADGSRVSGKLANSVQLVSGRYAMLDDGLGFSLVPWHPSLEKQLGRQISGVVRGDSVSWRIGRELGISM